MDLVSTPLLPQGLKVPASRNEDPSKRLRRLLASKPYVFGPGVYDPMGAELVMYHGFDAVYFSGYSFAIGHLGTTDMDLYSSVEIADGARRTVSALRKFQLTMAMATPTKRCRPSTWKSRPWSWTWTPGTETFSTCSAPPTCTCAPGSPQPTSRTR